MKTWDTESQNTYWIGPVFWKEKVDSFLLSPQHLPRHSAQCYFIYTISFIFRNHSAVLLGTNNVKTLRLREVKEFALIHTVNTAGAGFNSRPIPPGIMLWCHCSLSCPQCWSQDRAARDGGDDIQANSRIQVHQDMRFQATSSQWQQMGCDPLVLSCPWWSETP